MSITKEQLKADIDAMNAKASRLESAAKEPNRKGRDIGKLFGGTPPNVTRQLGERPYSFLKMMAFCGGKIGEDGAVEELQVHKKLSEIYQGDGFSKSQANSVLVPSSSYHLPTGSTKAESLAREVREKMLGGYDPDQAAWEARRSGMREKALGTLSMTAGGSLVAGPALGELIDLQRNMEALSNAGASEIGLPPNGRIKYPKLSGAATAYWVGEGNPIAESEFRTGEILFEAKKIGTLTRLNNELFKFSSTATEAAIRTDMARTAALLADKAMLEGTGGTQIKGLITYETATSWSTGVDKLLTATAGVVGTNGNKFQVEDAERLESLLPDDVDPSAWIMRKSLYTALMNRRHDAVTAGDEKGQLLFQQDRASYEKGGRNRTIRGLPVVATSQVSNTRVKASGTDLTYVLCGRFADWLIARMGIMEFLINTMSDTAMINDQTYIRGLQYIDAAARHLSSFAFMDQLIVG